MTKITWKPGTMLSPLPPAMISCGSVEKPNVMTAAWTGIVSSEPAMTYVSIRPSRYSHELIKESGEFVINLTTLDLVVAADFCGVKSGRDTDKFKEMNLTAEACSEVSAPQIAESPLSLECKVKSVTNYGSHDMFLAEIVAVNVDDKYIDANGKLCLEKAGLVAYSHGHYFTLGRDLGSFGFSVNKARLKLMKKMENVKVEVKTSKIIEEDSEAKTEKKDRTPKAFGERRRSSSDSRNKGRSFSRDDRPQRDFGGEERKPRRDFDDGERRAPRRDGDGERRPYNRDGGERRAPRRDGDGERRPYNRDGGERRAPRRDGDGERRPYNRDGGERRAPRRDGDGERRPYNRDGGERRAPRQESSDAPRTPRKHYGKRKEN